MSTASKQILRVFVSYSSDDKERAAAVFRHLRGLSCRPFEEFSPGQHFDREIMRLIEYSHLFMPILTGDREQNPGSQVKPWVNQEIGYALGRNVPILPLALDTVPKGLVTGIQTLELKRDLTDLEAKVTRAVLERVFRDNPFGREAPHELALEPEDRSRMMVGYLEDVSRYGTGRVRLRGAFTAFSIPDRHPTDPLWERREGAVSRSHDARKLLQKERRLFERFAREAGCDLILNPVLESARYGPDCIRVRLELLLEFLRSMPSDGVRVAVRDDGSVENRAIVGDWFVADAIVPLGGSRLRKTVFTRHGPTVLERIEEFDDMLRDVVPRDEGIRQLERLLDRL